MVGRAARKEEEEADVDVFLSSKTYHFYLSKLALSENQDFAHLEKYSLTCLYNALTPGKCTWKPLLAYFQEPMNETWQCETRCANCRGEGIQPNSKILEHRAFNTALITIRTIPNISKTVLYNLLMSTPSTLEKVPTETQNLFFACKDRNFETISHYNKAKDFVANLVDEGIVKLDIERGCRAAVLRLTEKGVALIDDNQHSDPTGQSQHECYLPTTEMINECPCPTEFSTPNDEELQKIHDASEMTDELFEICMKIPVLKGLIVLDVEETNRKICIPKQIVDEIWCTEHKEWKKAWGSALKPFHRWPRYITWSIATRWKKKNTFNDGVLGLSIKWQCAHRSFNCVAQKTWRTLAEAEHNGKCHVIMEEVYDNIGTGPKNLLNRHIHPCGAKIKKEKKESLLSPNTCCNYNMSIVKGEFHNAFTEDIFPQKVVAQPVFTFMEQLLQGYNSDPVQAQINSTVTYSKTRNIQHSMADSARPWLKDVLNESSLSRIQRVQLLQQYIDGQEKKNKGSLCPSYIGTITQYEHDIFTVICTDLFGITLYSLATKKKDCVISCDGTGNDLRLPDC